MVRLAAIQRRHDLQRILAPRRFAIARLHAVIVHPPWTWGRGDARQEPRRAQRLGDGSTTLLGPWYATAVFWKPQIALFVNERTLLPVLMPLAPAATLLARFPQQLAVVLAAHQTPEAFIEAEAQRMRDWRLAKTANRSVVGIMNEFTCLADAHHDADPGRDLLDLSVQLATTPCSPLYGKHISPDRELAALVAASTVV